MALPFTDASFDAAVMALVLFFVPDPAKGVAEMARVVRPGGLVAAYLWDFAAGGFPFHPIQVEMRAMGLTPLLPPSVQASRMDVLLDLWAGAGFKNVESRVITVTRSFASFEEFWTISTNGTGMRPIIEAMAPADTELLKSRVKVRLPADAEGRITYQGTANAIKGRVRPEVRILSPSPAMTFTGTAGLVFVSAEAAAIVAVANVGAERPV